MYFPFINFFLVISQNETQLRVRQMDKKKEKAQFQ